MYNVQCLLKREKGDLRAAGGVQKQSEQSGDARAEAVICKERIFELIFTDHVLCNN